MPIPLSERATGRPQVRSALTSLADLHQNVHRAPRHAVVPTGFDALDEALAGGVRQGEVLLLGGKPGIGKTIASLQWARTMARRGVVVVVLSFEHDEITLLTRLLSCELGEMLAASPGGDPAVLHELRERIRDVGTGAISLREALRSDPRLGEAHRRLVEYGDRLVLVTGSGPHTALPAIAELTRPYENQPVALFVDYVQKVRVAGSELHDGARAGQVVEGLKELALDQRLVVVAVAAADHVGLEARRLRARHLRGSTALAYDADITVMLNEKHALVSRPSGYSPDRTAAFRHQVVFSVEKNRNGAPGVHLEFEKDFAHYRFHPHGRRVAERLWDEESIEP